MNVCVNMCIYVYAHMIACVNAYVAMYTNVIVCKCITM